VRVSVEAGIPPADRQEKIANTLCYDYIIDGIRGIVMNGHIKLAETLAERIAEHILAHPLAREVMVRVEKLDRVPDAALGVEIFRRKPKEGEQAGDKPATIVRLLP
jgi:dihydroneopterin aldolase